MRPATGNTSWSRDLSDFVGSNHVFPTRRLYLICRKFHSNEGLTLETSALQSLFSDSFTDVKSVGRINSNYFVITLNWERNRNLPPCNCDKVINGDLWPSTRSVCLRVIMLKLRVTLWILRLTLWRANFTFPGLSPVQRILLRSLDTPSTVSLKVFLNSPHIKSATITSKCDGADRPSFTRFLRIYIA